MVQVRDKASRTARQSPLEEESTIAKRELRETGPLRFPSMVRVEEKFSMVCLGGHWDLSQKLATKVSGIWRVQAVKQSV